MARVPNVSRNLLARTGRNTTAAIAELGYQASLLAESVRWICAGTLRNQPVRSHQVVAQMVKLVQQHRQTCVHVLSGRERGLLARVLLDPDVATGTRIVAD